MKNRARLTRQQIEAIEKEFNEAMRANGGKPVKILVELKMGMVFVHHLPPPKKLPAGRDI